MTTDLTWLTAMEYLCHKWYVPLLVNTSRSLPHSWLITGFVTRLTRRVPLVDQELLTLPKHLSSYSIFSFMFMFCSFDTLPSSSCINILSTTYQEEFEDTKGIIRIPKSKKNRQHNGQKKKYKKTNSDLQNTKFRGVYVGITLSVRPCTLWVQLLLSDLFDFYETLHICSTLPADVHEGIWLLSKI
jgi:hypothetical protein